MEICEVISSHHKIIILDNVAIILGLFTHFDFDPALPHHIASYHTPFLIVTVTVNVFLH